MMVPEKGRRCEGLLAMDACCWPTFEKVRTDSLLIAALLP